MTAIDTLGYLACSLVLATFFMTSMVPLRLMALASNLAFIAYGYEAGIVPVLVLHAVLLPVNAIRLLQRTQCRPDTTAPVQGNVRR